MIMDIGDSEVIGVSVLPTNATNKDVIWSSSDEEVVTIKNGVITAKKVGEAIVYVNSMEYSDIQEEISVTVQNISDEVVSTPTPTSSVTPTPLPTVPPTTEPTIDPTSPPTVVSTSMPMGTPPQNPPIDNSEQDSIHSVPQDVTEDSVIKKGDIVTKKKMKYKVTKVKANGGGEVSLVGTAKKKNDKKFKSLKIGKSIKINGKLFKITSIGSKAFRNYKYLKKITIGKNATKIGKKAFYKCKKVKNLVIQSTKLKAVGKKAISGINMRVRIKVPKKQMKKYRELFRTKTGYKKTMKIGN